MMILYNGLMFVMQTAIMVVYASIYVNRQSPFEFSCHIGLIWDVVICRVFDMYEENGEC